MRGGRPARVDYGKGGVRLPNRRDTACGGVSATESADVPRCDTRDRRLARAFCSRRLPRSSHRADAGMSGAIQPTWWRRTEIGYGGKQPAVNGPVWVTEIEGADATRKGGHK